MITNKSLQLDNINIYSNIASLQFRIINSVHFRTF